ncbi:hypothetical protein GCM10010467_14340 [Actinocorallia glomerata]|uniref:PD-(D/E)XK motif protein n=3 Tax=Actinomycetota TaxID=201174 RepID=A0ABP6M3X8_9MICC
MTDDLTLPGAEWFRRESVGLRTASFGVGKRVLTDGGGIRFQSLGDGTVGLRIPVPRGARVSTTIELVHCDTKLVGDSYVLEIVERSPRSAEQSAAFFADVVRRLHRVPQDRNTEHVEAALRHWRSVFATRRELLSEEQILGLFGELVILDHLLDRGIGSRAVHAWTGPAGDDHDFTLSGEAQIECKSTAPHSERLFISNEHQLEAGDVPLILACIRLSFVDKEDDGTSLPELASRIDRRLPADGSVQEFDQKLAEVGLDRTDDRYRLIRLQHTETRFYEVRGDMPRVVPGDLRPGVSQVRYQIVTSDLHEYEVDDIPLGDVLDQRS